MRALSIIKAEIEKTEKSSTMWKNEKASAGYSSKGPTVAQVFQGIFALILSVIAGVLAGAVGEAAEKHDFGIVLILFTLGFLAGAIVCAARFLSRRAPRAFWIIFMLFSGFFNVVSGMGLLNGIQKKSLLAMWFPEFAKDLEIEVGTTATLCVYSVILAVSAAVTIGSLIRFLIEVKKKSDCKKRIAELQSKIDFADNTVATLKKEQSTTAREIDRLYHEEFGKATPDTEQMQKLADLGSSDAEKWLTDKQNAERAAKGRAIYAAEIQKTQPDIEKMKEAANLGNPYACFWMAKHMTYECLMHYYDYDESEFSGYFVDVSGYLLHADGCGEPEQVKLFRLIADDMMYVYGNYDNKKRSKQDNLDALAYLRKMKNSSSTEKDREFADEAITRVKRLIEKIDDKEYKKKMAAQMSYESSYSSYQPSNDRDLTQSEMRDYLSNKMHNLWMPSSIDNDPDLTPSQKEQMKDYARIYGD